MSKEPFSYHHFFFPFRWDVLPAGFKKKKRRKESLPFDERTELGKFHKHITQQHWQHREFSFENDDGSFNHIHYNEFTYYHDFVRKVIYDYRLPYQSERDYHTLGEVRYYEYKLQEGGEHLYIIRQKSRTEGIPAELKLRVQGVSLHVFNTGIGILAFSLANDEYDSERAVRYINEYGRRIYPQFIRPEKEGFVKPAKGAFLADEIELVLNDTPLPVEDFEDYPQQCSAEEPFIPPAFFKTLFGDDFLFCVKEDLGHESILISRVLDDRMFFLCWYGNDEWSNKFIGDVYQYCDWWYGYIFGDKSGKSISNSALQKEQSIAHTYARWAGYGTLYGMSRDSFVSISQTSATLKKFDAPPVAEHINSTYYTMVVLCLAQRASLLKFSAEVAYLGNISGKRSRELLREVKDLHRNYIEFVNKIYFREVTSQIQGIELYSQLQGIMQIPEDAKDLEREIGNLFNYVRLEAEEQETAALNRLQKVGFPLLVLSLVIGLMGVNGMPIGKWTEHQVALSAVLWWSTIALSAGLCVAGIFWLSRSIQKRMNHR